MQTLQKANYIKHIETFDINNRRYIGSKYKLINHIQDFVLTHCQDVNLVADIFGGTGIVTDLFRKIGKGTIVNDLLLSNYYIYTAFFSDLEYDKNKIQEIITEFNNIELISDNYVSEHFGNAFFSYGNAKKIGYLREKIENIKFDLTEREYAILITSLVYAMDKVANTCGHYDAFRRTLSETQAIKFFMPNINDELKPSKIYQADANLLVKDIKADLVYIDPPYNSRQYGDAYHLLENIVSWKQEEVYGVAKKYQNRTKSRYCTIQAHQAFSELIENINTRYIVVSYNNMGQKGSERSNAKISHEEILDILSQKGKVTIQEIGYQPFSTGKSNIQDHKELLYLCEC
ncbi:MAG: DNA adenine methylase [Brevinema sp.]